MHKRPDHSLIEQIKAKQNKAITPPLLIKQNRKEVQFMFNTISVPHWVQAISYCTNHGITYYDHHPKVEDGKLVVASGGYQENMDEHFGEEFVFIDRWGVSYSDKETLTLY